MDLESASRELYAGSPDDFVARRKALVAQARAAKDRQLANAIGALRRPTRSAWLVNLYAREAPEELAELLDLGAALQAAQQQLSGPDLRRLSTERGKALSVATRRAVALGRDHDYDAPESARAEVTQTLQAALADPEIAAQVRAGTLSQAQSYGGFGFALPSNPTPAPSTAPTATPPAEPTEPLETEEAARRRAAEEERHRDRERAEQQVEDAEAALATASEEAHRATAHADELAERVEQLRAELASAEEAETAARQDARAARRVVGERERAVQDARDALTAL